MKWTADADLAVGITVASGKKRLGFGFRIGRKKTVTRIGVDLAVERLVHFCLFLLKDSDVFSRSWSSVKTYIVQMDRDKAMKRSNVFNLLLQMMPSSMQASSASPAHWAFLEQIDAPQWVDLTKEAALMGTQGDHPWFYRRHSHHEASLARADNPSFPGAELFADKPEQPTEKKVARVKGSVSKLLKPSLKAHAMTACLGGTQRVSNAGSKDGRNSARLRLTNQPRPRTPKKVQVQRPGQQKIAAQAAVARSDTKLAARDSLSNAAKKENETKIDSFRFNVPPINTKQEPKSESIGTGRFDRSSDQTVLPRDSLSQRSFPSAKDPDSAGSSRRLYRLPSPPPKEINSSPSDMTLSTQGSPTTSSSSQENGILPSGPLITSYALGRERSKDQLGSPQELRVAPESAGVSLAEVIQSSREISLAPESTSHPLKGGSQGGKRTSAPDKKRRMSSPRLKRKSLGPPLRVIQVTDRLGSSGAKKKSSSPSLGRLKTNELPGRGASHPILEKLRRSWGSALRVSQRKDAEAAGVQSSSGDIRQNSATEQKVGTPEHNPYFLLRTDKGNLLSRKSENVHMQPEFLGRVGPAGEAMQSSGGQGLVRSIFNHERQIPHRQADPGIQVLPSPGRTGKDGADSRVEKSARTTDGKTSAPPDKAVGLAKIQANHQKSKAESSSKFKKQYAFPETGVSKTLRANKENMEMRLRAPETSTQPDKGRKLHGVPPASNMSTSTRQSHSAARHSPVASPTNGLRNGQQAARPSSDQMLNPHTGNSTTTKRDIDSRSTRTTGKAAAKHTSTQRSESLVDRKLNNSAMVGMSTTSLPKFTRQKSERTSSASAKDATIKACKTGSRVADESLIAEEHKSKVVPKYEPRIHSAKAIKEWETKSGLRYYDLQPTERQIVNKQITAAAERAMKRNVV